MIQAHSNAGAVLTQKRMVGDAKIAQFFLRFGLPEVISFWQVGHQAFLLDKLGLSAAGIALSVKQFLRG